MPDNLYPNPPLKHNRDEEPPRFGSPVDDNDVEPQPEEEEGGGADGIDRVTIYLPRDFEALNILYDESARSFSFTPRQGHRGRRPVQVATVVVRRQSGKESVTTCAASSITGRVTATANDG